MILQFQSLTARSAFITRIQSEAPQLSSQIKPSFSQPTVVTLAHAAAVNEQTVDLVKRLARGEARVFEDVKLDVMQDH